MTILDRNKPSDCSARKNNGLLPFCLRPALALGYTSPTIGPSESGGPYDGGAVSAHRGQAASRSDSRFPTDPARRASRYRATTRRVSPAVVRQSVSRALRARLLVVALGAASVLTTAVGCSKSPTAPTTTDHTFQGVWVGLYAPTACTGDTLLCSVILSPPPLTGPITVNVQHTNETASGSVTIGNFVLNTSGNVSGGTLTFGQSSSVTLNGSTARLQSLTATVASTTMNGVVRFVLGSASITANLQNVVKQAG